MADMSPADVPQDLLDAAMDVSWDLSFPDETARTILAAVLPLYEQQLREQIAGELYGLPIVQHLGLARSNATQPMVNAAEAAQRWMITVVQRPDLIPERGA